MMSIPTSSTPSQDERIMAALAHVTTLVPFMGVIAPIVIWTTQREKSQYVAFQALQALAYQLTMILAWFVGMGCYMCSAFSIFLTVPFASAADQEQTVEPLFGLVFFIPFLVFGAILVGGIAFVIYGFVGAIMALQGKPFRYVLIGGRVERFMQKK
jgi:uncharacterized Tic20 family protein